MIVLVFISEFLLQVEAERAGMIAAGHSLEAANMLDEGDEDLLF